MRIDIRISAEQKEKWQETAKGLGITLTKFIIDSVEDAIESVHTNEDNGVVEGKGAVHTNKYMDDTEDIVHTDEFRSYFNKEELQ